jgi:hypothetical protein
MSSSRFSQYNGDNPRGNSATNRVLFGIGIVILGIGLMLKTLGLISFSFHLSWPIILIIIGVLSGLKNGFRNNSWWILITIGTVYLIPQFQIMGKSSKQFVWPALIIIIGIMIAFRPRRNKKHCYGQPTVNSHITPDSRMNLEVIFGGRKEIITAKDFKGGTISVTFGGCDINLTQADFSDESITLDCNVVFGGVELIVPAHWDVQNDIKPVLGAVEDDRVIHVTQSGEIRKKLILQGNCTFGGIEIKSY